MMCFGEIVDKICEKCKPFVLSTNFEPKKENNQASKLLLKDQFMSILNLSLKTVEKTGETFVIFNNFISKY